MTTVETLPTSARRGRLRHLGDSAFAAVATWVLLAALVCVDVPLLKPMVAAATDDQPVLSWTLTIGIGAALAACIGLATEYFLRYLERRAAGSVVAAAVLALLWAAAVGFSYFFRKAYAPATGNTDLSPILTGEAPAAPTGDPLLAALLTSLLILTGAIAAAVTALAHDEVQKDRRSSARRVLRLRIMRRWSLRTESRHATAAKCHRLEIDDIARRTKLAREQLAHTADSLKHQMRVKMAIALGDPMTTTALTRGAESEKDGDAQ